MTTCPAGPVGHRLDRSSRLARSSRISAHGSAGMCQPVDEAVRRDLGARPRSGRPDRASRLGETGDDPVPAARRHPDQRLYRPGGPQRVGERHRELRLARAALRRRRDRGFLGVGQHHGVARVQARPEVKPGFRALVEGLGERRDASRQLHWRRRRRCPRPLRNHVDSLSRVARRPGPEILAQPLPELPTGCHHPPAWPPTADANPSAGPRRDSRPRRNSRPRRDDSPGARSWRRAPFCTCTTVRYKGMLVVIPGVAICREKCIKDLNAASIGISWLVTPRPRPGRRARRGDASL